MGWVFVYGVCAGSSDRLAATLARSLEARGLGPLLVRLNQSSIFAAYNSLMDEAIGRWPDLEGLVLVHEDVVIEDERFEEKLRAAFADPKVGVAGVIGGVGHWEMSWWRTAREKRHGHVGSPEKVEDYSRGTHDVDTVDGLLMALAPGFVRSCRLDGSGYPGFHGYDSELCAVAREAEMHVIVADLDVFHDHKASGDHTVAYGWANHEWMLRWRSTRRRGRLKWRVKRAAARALAAGDPGRTLPGLLEP